MHVLIGAARFAAVFVYILCCFVIIFGVFPFSTPEGKGRVIRRWSARLLRWLGVRIKVFGRYDGDPLVQDCGITHGRTGRLVVSNHVSFLDIFALNSVMPSAFVAKAEIARWPVFGMIASSVDTVFIERGSRRSLLRTAEAMAKALTAGRNLLMFPEGTTSDGTGLKKLHGNLMEGAVRQQAEVIPVVLRYTTHGRVTTTPAYVGDVGLFECLWKVVTMDELTLEIHMLDPRTGDDRHTLCREVSADMCSVIGCADPLAEPVAAPAAPAAQEVQA
jgi:1-acyl-sn-glycerol-3-phosphate acyltransferase